MSGYDVMMSGRALAESMMVDTVLVERRRLDGSGSPVTEMDPDTLQVQDVWDQVYSGPAKMRLLLSRSSGDPVAGDVPFSEDSVWLDLPVTDESAGVHSKDRATVQDSPNDPDAVGRALTIVRSLNRTFAVERRFLCSTVDVVPLPAEVVNL